MVGKYDVHEKKRKRNCWLNLLKLQEKLLPIKWMCLLQKVTSSCPTSSCIYLTHSQCHFLATYVHLKHTRSKPDFPIISVAFIYSSKQTTEVFCLQVTQNQTFFVCVHVEARGTQNSTVATVGYHIKLNRGKKKKQNGKKLRPKPMAVCLLCLILFSQALSKKCKNTQHWRI